jgi:hypothetical protein
LVLRELLRIRRDQRGAMGPLATFAMGDPLVFLALILGILIVIAIIFGIAALLTVVLFFLVAFFLPVVLFLFGLYQITQGRVKLGVIFAAVGVVMWVVFSTGVVVV